LKMQLIPQRLNWTKIKITQVTVEFQQNGSWWHDRNSMNPWNQFGCKQMIIHQDTWGETYTQTHRDKRAVTWAMMLWSWISLSDGRDVPKMLVPIQLLWRPRIALFPFCCCQSSYLHPLNDTKVSSWHLMESLIDLQREFSANFVVSLRPTNANVKNENWAPNLGH
jgi:hypothetical protein